MVHCLASVGTRVLGVLGVLSLASGICAAEASAADLPVELGGFVDGQAQASTAVDSIRGFMVNDGALYLSKTVQSVTFLIDMPFRLVQAGTPNLEFAAVKAQAFVGQQFKNGFRWKVGQFDTSYGLEANDTVAVPFTRQGNVYNFTDPFVHLGFQAGYDFAETYAVNLLVASPSDSGTLGPSKRPQMGLQLVKSGDRRFSIGALVTALPGLDRYSYYGDMTAGLTLGRVLLDAEVNVQKRVGEKTADGKALPLGVGSLAQVLVQVTRKLSAGVRGEFISSLSHRDPRANVLDEYLKYQTLVFVGPQYRLHQSLVVKADYSLQLDQKFSGQEDTIHGVQASAVYKF